MCQCTFPVSALQCTWINGTWVYSSWKNDESLSTLPHLIMEWDVYEDWGKGKNIFISLLPSSFLNWIRERGMKNVDNTG